MSSVLVVDTEFLRRYIDTVSQPINLPTDWIITAAIYCWDQSQCVGDTSMDVRQWLNDYINRTQYYDVTQYAAANGLLYGVALHQVLSYYVGLIDDLVEQLDRRYRGIWHAFVADRAMVQTGCVVRNDTAVLPYVPAISVAEPFKLFQHKMATLYYDLNPQDVAPAR